MFLSAPWADALFAVDSAWWQVYERQVRRKFKGMCFAGSVQPGLAIKGQFPTFRNSGCGALSLAHWGGARKIVMVGFDCQKTGGKVHSHGDHPPTLGNANSMPEWINRFRQCAKHLAKRTNLTVINASRETVLPYWRRMSLEDALNA